MAYGVGFLIQSSRQSKLITLSESYNYNEIIFYVLFDGLQSKLTITLSELYNYNKQFYTLLNKLHATNNYNFIQNKSTSKGLSYFKYVYECVSVCEYVHVSVGANGDQKRVQTTWRWSYRELSWELNLGHLQEQCRSFCKATSPTL